jgi:hypothetical protein
VLKSERGRRNVRRRKSYTGGVFWKKHNPNTTRCRCKDCMHAREAKAKSALAAVPKREQPVGRIAQPAVSPASPARPKGQSSGQSTVLVASQSEVIGIGSRVRVKGEKLWVGTVTYQKRIRRKTIWTVEFDHHGPPTGQGWYTDYELILIE